VREKIYWTGLKLQAAIRESDLLQVAELTLEMQELEDQAKLMLATPSHLG
jgi:hypothetical protein